MIRSRSRGRASLPSLLLLVAASAPSLAHQFSITEARLWLRADRTYQLDVRVDVDALALGVSPLTDSAETAAAVEALDATSLELAIERARDTLARRVRIRADDRVLRPTIEFPPPETASERDRALPSALGVIARFEGPLPEDTAAVSVFLSRSFGATHLTIVDEVRLTGDRQLLEPGERSRPWPLAGDVAAAAPPPVPVPPRRSTIGRYLALGFEHILPLGLDHILFVLGLFLLSRRLGPLLVQISAFTVAHTATLALAMYGLVSLPSRLVETLIALSIAYVAFENVFTESMKPWRPALVFVFGLLHGLGFAGVLIGLGLPRGRFVEALVSFNVGVELGQLAVVLLALAALGWFRGRAWYRRRIVIPLSLGIGAIGLYWAVERAFG